MNQRRRACYSVKKSPQNFYSYICRVFWRHCPMFFPGIFFPLFSGFSRGALAEMKAVFESCPKCRSSVRIMRLAGRVYVVCESGKCSYARCWINQEDVSFCCCGGCCCSGCCSDGAGGGGLGTPSSCHPPPLLGRGHHRW